MRSAIAVLGLLASTSLASAADFGGPSYDGSLKDGPVLAQQSWSGLYVGANVGYGWADLDSTPIFDPQLPEEGVRGDFEPDGWLGGGQIGYNFQSGQVVFGVEADYQWADLNDSASASFNVKNPLDITTSVDVQSFGTVRGRIGLSLNRVLPYLTAGFAWADVKGQTRLSYGPGPEANWKGGDSAVHTGWVVGGGVEVALDPRWSAKAEYLYFDLGEKSYTTTFVNGAGEVGDTYKNDADLTMHTFRVGVNYRFGH